MGAISLHFFFFETFPGAGSPGGIPFVGFQTLQNVQQQLGITPQQLMNFRFALNNLTGLQNIAQPRCAIQQAMLRYPPGYQPTPEMTQQNLPLLPPSPQMALSITDVPSEENWDNEIMNHNESEIRDGNITKSSSQQDGGVTDSKAEDEVLQQENKPDQHQKENQDQYHDKQEQQDPCQQQTQQLQEPFVFGQRSQSTSGKTFGFEKKLKKDFGNKVNVASQNEETSDDPPLPLPDNGTVTQQTDGEKNKDGDGGDETNTVQSQASSMSKGQSESTSNKAKQGREGAYIN